MSVDVRGVLAWIRLYPFRTWLAFALAIILSLVVGIIRSSSNPPSRVAPVNAEASRSPNADTVTAQVTDTGLTLNHPGGASLSIPPGGIAGRHHCRHHQGQRIGARPARRVAAGSGQLGCGRLGRTTVHPVDADHPYDPGEVPAGANPLVTTYDELSGWWVPVRTSVAVETHRLIAELPGSP